MRLPAALAALALSLPASASNVYILSSGDPTTDNAVIAALTSRGHTCTLGPQFFNFTGSQSLVGFQTVYLQSNYNWAFGEMSLAGAQALRNWVQAGGRLVTCEWTAYYSATGEAFAPIASILPLVQSYEYGSATSTVYMLVTPDPAINAGLDNFGFGFSLDDYAGTETYTTAKTGATVYYRTTGRSWCAGLAGWTRGAGSVYSFSTTCGPTQLASATFGRLFSNVMGPVPCYPNCDASTIAPTLNVQDFSCFLGKLAAGDAYANCDGSTQPPVFNVADFSCFLAKYAAGCL